MQRLITIAFSHYNERARWGLDRFGVAYRDERYLPMLHLAPVAHATRHYRDSRTSDRVSSSLSTPVLLTDDDRCIADSGRILRYVSDRYGNEDTGLFPSSEVEALSQRFHDELGPHTRRVGYFYVLKEAAVVKEMARNNVGWAQALAFSLARPVATVALKRLLRVDEVRTKRSLDKVRAVFADVSERVRDRRYLSGDRFSAADLTFASLAAPVLLVSRQEGYSATFPEIECVSREFQDVVGEFRATAAGAYALRMFAEERSARRATELA